MATQVTPVATASAGTDPAMAAADAAGNDIINAGRGTLLIFQTAGTPANVTIKTQKAARPADAQFAAQAVADTVVALPATGIRVVGPFEAAFIKSTNSGTIEVRYDSVVNLKIGAVKVPS